MKELEAKNTI